MDDLGAMVSALQGNWPLLVKLQRMLDKDCEWVGEPFRCFAQQGEGRERHNSMLSEVGFSHLTRPFRESEATVDLEAPECLTEASDGPILLAEARWTTVLPRVAPDHCPASSPNSDPQHLAPVLDKPTARGKQDFRETTNRCSQDPNSNKPNVKSCF